VFALGRLPFLLAKCGSNRRGEKRRSVTSQHSSQKRKKQKRKRETTTAASAEIPGEKVTVVRESESEKESSKDAAGTVNSGEERRAPHYRKKHIMKSTYTKIVRSVTPQRKSSAVYEKERRDGRRDHQKQRRASKQTNRKKKQKQMIDKGK
jgi:hypothetical protein